VSTQRLAATEFETLDARAEAAVLLVEIAAADPDYFIPHVDLTQIPEYRLMSSAISSERSLTGSPAFQPLGRLP
jgi:hypothetical protein